MSPIYVYACECGHTEDVILPVADRDSLDAQCPKCGGALKRAMTAPAFHGEVYHMAGILPSGERVKGHFGK